MVIINGLRAIENLVTTVPLDILVTPARPDIVFVNKNNSITIIIELTIPFDAQETFDQAHTLKSKNMKV